MNKYIVGLDIGTTKIACFIGEQAQNGKLRIVGFGKTESLGVERGVVKNIDDTADSIRRAVAEASEMAKFDVKEVYVGIAGQHIKSRPNQGSVMIPDGHRRIDRSDVDRLIADQYRVMLDPGEEIIHVFPQTFEVDGDVLDENISPIGVNGRSLKANFHIVTGNADNIRNIRDAVVEAGLKIVDVVLEPIASAYAVLDNLDKDAGVALVDIGGGTTDIALFKDGIIRHTSVLPLAGNVITSDIKEGCKIMRAQAEMLKVKFGSCMPSAVNQDDIISIPGIRNQPAREISVKTLAGIVKSRMQMLLEQVGFELESSGYQDSLIAGVVLTGGGSHMMHAKEFAELVLGIDTRIGTPDEHIDKDSSIPFEDLAHPMYATGIGLVIYGILDSQKKTRVEAASHVSEEVEKGEKVEEEEVVEAPQPAQPEVEEPDGNDDVKAKKAKDGFVKKVTNWLSNLMSDSDIDD